MRRPLRRQIMGPLLAVALASLAAVGAINAWLAADHTQERIERQLRGVVGVLTTSNFPLTAPVLRKMRDLSSAEFVLTDADGQALATSLDELPPPLPNAATVRRLEDVSLGPSLAVAGNEYFHTAMPLPPRSGDVERPRAARAVSQGRVSAELARGVPAAAGGGRGRRSPPSRWSPACSPGASAAPRPPGRRGAAPGPRRFRPRRPPVDRRRDSRPGPRRQPHRRDARRLRTAGAPHRADANRRPAGRQPGPRDAQRRDRLPHGRRPPRRGVPRRRPTTKASPSPGASCGSWRASSSGSCKSAGNPRKSSAARSIWPASSTTCCRWSAPPRATRRSSSTGARRRRAARARRRRRPERRWRST